MDQAKRKKLQAKGWKVGSAQDFLDLSDEEAAFIEMRLALAHLLAKRRKYMGYTQERIAKLLRSSQSRVAKMELGDPSVSIDLMIHSLLKLGASRKDIGGAIGSKPSRKTA